MIPDLIHLGSESAYLVLPPGVHNTNLNEVRRRFAFTPHRIKLLNGFRLGCKNLVSAGCKAIYLNGSFTTSKIHPNDFDACWGLRGVDFNLIDETLLDFRDQRAAQKAKFGGEFFMVDNIFSNEITFLEYFQLDRDTGKQKGILLVDCKIPMN